MEEAPFHVAYHEAAHAVALYVHGLTVNDVSAVPDPAGYRGRATGTPPENSPPIILRSLAVAALAGPAAQSRLTGSCSDEDAAGDLALARRYTACLVPESQRDVYLAYLEAVAADFVAVEGLKIAEFAVELQARGSMSGAEAMAKLDELTECLGTDWTQTDWP